MDKLALPDGPDEDEELIQADIDKLRSIGTPEAARHADALEVRLIAIKRKLLSSEEMTVERMKAWVAACVLEAGKRKLSLRDLAMWPAGLLHDLFGALQSAMAICLNRPREAAMLVGVGHGQLLDWLGDARYKAWVIDSERRKAPAATMFDLASTRMSFILALDSQNPDIVKEQVKAAKVVLVDMPAMTAPKGKTGKGMKELTGGHADLAAEQAASARAGRQRSVTKKD